MGSIRCMLGIHNVVCKKDDIHKVCVMMKAGEREGMAYKGACTRCGKQMAWIVLANGFSKCISVHYFDAMSDKYAWER